MLSSEVIWMAIRPGSLIWFDKSSDSPENNTSSNWLKLPGEPFFNCFIVQFINKIHLKEDKVDRMMNVMTYVISHRPLVGLAILFPYLDSILFDK